MHSRRTILKGLALAPEMYNRNGLAILGADVVSYFCAGQFQPGDPAIALMWRGVRWHFATPANRDAFEMNPRSYCPEFGGYCAYALAESQIGTSDPAAFTVHQGRIYLNYSLQVRRLWLAILDRYIMLAERNWPVNRAN
ncbi:MAG: YHS domain protein [Rhodobacterales bacterium]|nr:YHS domain protein [Rhodobacterales bacterium]